MEHDGNLMNKLTNPLDDAGERFLHVGGAGIMRLNVVGDWSELPATHVLTNVRDVLLNAARHVVAPVRHASGKFSGYCSPAFTLISQFQFFVSRFDGDSFAVAKAGFGMAGREFDSK